MIIVVVFVTYHIYMKHADRVKPPHVNSLLRQYFDSIPHKLDDTQTLKIYLEIYSSYYIYKIWIDKRTISHILSLYRITLCVPKAFREKIKMLHAVLSCS